MRIKSIHLKNKNQLVKDYMNQHNDMDSFFDYLPYEEDEKRLTDLKFRSFPREELADTLHRLNTNWNAPIETLEQIKRLKEENSVVVIGGQQAGLLTGPMYTVNKIISILKYAKEKEEKLQVPVIPVFWIAGEDHDYDEINHIFLNEESRLFKHTTPQSLYFKKSISSVELDQKKTITWLEQAFSHLQETEYTKMIYESILSSLRDSKSYVDFFSRFIFTLFPNEGLVLIDSGDFSIRQLEREGFKKLIENQPEITNAVYTTVQKLEQKGYSLSLEAGEDDAHLFYHDSNNERILLKRSGDEWIGKNDEIKMTTNELLHTAEKEPERLSNNVVTRPIMQELLFPTLAFIGGHGEISYWAALKGAFQAVDRNLKVPPVVPRLSFTFITNRVEKLLENRVIDPEFVLNDDIDQLKISWLLSQETPPVKTLFAEVKEKMDQIHQPLRQFTTSLGADLGEEAEKNLQLIIRQLTYLEHKTNMKLEEKYELALTQYDEIKNCLKPDHLLQERVWSPLLFLNEYGFDFIRKVIHEPSLSFEHDHYLVYLR